MTRKITVLSIVNRGGKIPCHISNRQSYFISKGTSSVISKRQTASFRNDGFAFDLSIINLNVLSKWQIIYHFEMRSHNLIPIRWVPNRSRQQDREKCREPGTAPNFVRKLCPAGRSWELWCICKSSSFLLLFCQRFQPLSSADSLLYHIEKKKRVEIRKLDKKNKRVAKTLLSYKDLIYASSIASAVIFCLRVKPESLRDISASTYTAPVSTVSLSR